MVLIFGFWVFSFKKNLTLVGGTHEWQEAREKFREIGNLFDEFKTNLEKIKEKLPQPKKGKETLSEEQIQKLKEKIEEHARTKGTNNK